MLKILHKKDGQIIVFFAGLAATLILLTAFVLSLGVVLYAHTRINGATEAAALAASDTIDANTYRQNGTFVVICSGGAGSSGGTMAVPADPTFQNASTVLTKNIPSAVLVSVICNTDGSVTVNSSLSITLPLPAFLPGTLSVTSSESAKYFSGYTPT